MKILDLGCGTKKYPGSVGVDAVRFDGVDVVHDLNTFPYPFEDSSFDEIRMDNVIEHIEDPVRAFREMYRICKPHGRVIIIAPHFSNYNSWSDPTHKRVVASNFAEYSIRLSNAGFRVKKTTLQHKFFKISDNILLIHLLERFSFLFGGFQMMLWELEALK